MRKLRLLAIMIVVFMMMSIIPTSAFVLPLRFSDVKNDYWGKASIDYVSSKGYMVGYGDEFGILDNVTEGQYLAVLCRIFGYENQSPLTVEGPARELGLLQKNDVVNVTKNLTRGDIAKYTIRAFEKLNNTSYPDYLEAYKGIIQDYDELSGELKPIALKCVEKGLLAGGSDGRFSPNDETTRAQAAAFIHRILEQKERDKVKPIFADPDPEFEAFMNSPEAARVVNPHCYYKVIDGKVLFTKYAEKEPIFILPTHSNKDINKKFYEALKTLTNIAKEQGNYVHLRYGRDNSFGDYAWLDYYSSEESGGYSGVGHPNFTLNFETEPIKLHRDGSQKYNTDFIWEIVSLGSSDYYKWSGREEIIEKKYQLDEFKIPLKELFNTIYGKQAGELLYNHAINEWIVEWDAAYNNEEYLNKNVTYSQNLGLEVQNYTETYPYFGTNDLD